MEEDGCTAFSMEDLANNERANMVVVLLESISVCGEGREKQEGKEKKEKKRPVETTERRKRRESAPLCI